MTNSTAGTVFDGIEMTDKGTVATSKPAPKSLLTQRGKVTIPAIIEKILPSRRKFCENDAISRGAAKISTDGS